MRRILLLIATALLLAGCGSSPDSGGGGDDGGGNPASYDAAYDICAGGLKQTAELYSVPEERAEVTAIVAEQVSGGKPEDADIAEQGCGDALDGKPKQAP